MQEATATPNANLSVDIEMLWLGEKEENEDSS